MNATAFQVITDRIVSLLERGTVPWAKPWGGPQCAPKNLLNQKPYRGINAFVLGAQGYSSPYWLTYRQAESVGGDVKKWQKASPCLYWNWVLTTDEESGEQEKIPFVRYYSVFNLSQVEGIEPPKNDTPKREDLPIEAAQKIVEGMPQRPDMRHGINQAFYNPSQDFVALPHLNQFKTPEDYYSVCLHELCHATGHETRLARKGVTGSVAGGDNVAQNGRLGNGPGLVGKAI
jgi:antirestriction protein ArdC